MDATQASSFSYGTLPYGTDQGGVRGVPMVVENEGQRTQLRTYVNELLSEVRMGRRLVYLGLLVTVLFCSATFIMVCLASEYSKETVIVDGALTEKSSQSVVSTREHEEVIPSPLTADGSQGVKRITVRYPDGSLVSHKVSSVRRLACSAEHKEYCSGDGFHYLFETVAGAFAGLSTEMGHTFQEVEPDVLESIIDSHKARRLLAAGDTEAFASGVPGRPISI